MEKNYNPADIESRWYSAWLEEGCFKAQSGAQSDSFCIMIPPPNVTGVLTMGHVLNNTIQDILVRRARQSGKKVLWLPGTDHAGIATQTRVERDLKTQTGKSRHDFGREAFIEKACEWRDKHGGIIIEQLKRIGASCDWERCVHTLDDHYSKAVLTSFVELYKRGFIYRGKRMVNWCPVSFTALSDEEVIMKKQKSSLYTVRYEAVERPGEYIDVSTTRPETIMADAAIAVHPEDERYKHLIGLHVWRPLQRAQISVIADDAVIREFGTGALKVTPAHDPVDFQIGERHGLEFIDLMNPDGTLNALAGADFSGLERFAARKKAAEKLEALGLLIKTESYENNVGFSERAQVPVEPRISEQWFLRYPRVEESKDVVRKGHIRFFPERWTKTYLHWLDGIQDWCISRQLWWGHRIPVWYKKNADRSNPVNQHVSVQGPSDAENWEQDDDVLDTWFSSWLWPFATLGWPDAEDMKKRGFAQWYPTSDLVTGPDIIFFWVARMIMAGLEFTGNGQEGELSSEEIQKRLPFRNVYFTGIIRDAQGRKMSKSLGNSPDPIDLIEKFGADALRFGIMAMAPQGQDVFFQENGIEQGRNFCTKLWNACRYRLMQEEASADRSSLDAIAKRMNDFSPIDEAILSNLADTTQIVQKALDAYEFNQATKALSTFFWSDYCDWYLEANKHRPAESVKTGLAVQDFILRQFILLLHPLAPFITQELWHSLGFGTQFIQDVSAITDVRTFLKSKGCPFECISKIGVLREFVSAARSLKAQLGLGARKDIAFHFKPTAEADWIQEYESLLKGLIGYSSLSMGGPLESSPAVVTTLGTVYLKLSESGIDLSAERSRLKKELERLKKGLIAGESKLSNPDFCAKAPPYILEGARAELAQTRAKASELEALLALL
jgi:valyl-tRNA synthetase